jgi:hypothetical protein
MLAITLETFVVSIASVDIAQASTSYFHSSFGIHIWKNQQNRLERNAIVLISSNQTLLKE